MRWLDGITDLKEMSLSKLWEMVKNREKAGTVANQGGEGCRDREEQARTIERQGTGTTFKTMRWPGTIRVRWAQDNYESASTRPWASVHIIVTHQHSSTSMTGPRATHRDQEVSRDPIPGNLCLSPKTAGIILPLVSL